MRSIWPTLRLDSEGCVHRQNWSGRAISKEGDLTTGETSSEDDYKALGERFDLQSAGDMRGCAGDGDETEKGFGSP